MNKVKINNCPRSVALLTAMTLVAAVLCGCGNGSAMQPGESKAPTVVPSEPSGTQAPQIPDETVNEEKMTEVAMGYLNVQMPGDVANLLRWEKYTEGDTYIEAVLLNIEEGALELYRICFGSAYADSAIGTWDMDGEKIPVAVLTETHDHAAFGDEQMMEDYGKAMESIQYVVSAIQNDPRFCQEEEPVLRDNEVKTGYWDFAIPENMECLEEMTAESCKLSFFGLVNGEKYLLYTVCVGEPVLSGVLGTFMAEGTDHLVSIETNDLPPVEGWAESEANTLYMMMDSINDVIQTIVESEGFSTEIPE